MRTWLSFEGDVLRIGDILCHAVSREREELGVLIGFKCEGNYLDWGWGWEWFYGRLNLKRQMFISVFKGHVFYTKMRKMLYSFGKKPQFIIYITSGPYFIKVKIFLSQDLRRIGHL